MARVILQSLIVPAIKLRQSPGMGFHCEEEHIASGSIDNRTKGRTLITIHFTNQTSSLVTLEGNPCRDLAGSLWNFKNPDAEMEVYPGEQCYFIPCFCDGKVGRISYSRKRKVSLLSPDDLLDWVADETKGAPPMKFAPTLDLEWFTEDFGRVEIDCSGMTLELEEMVWSLSAEEAAEQERLIDQERERYEAIAEESVEGYYGEMDYEDDDHFDSDPDLHNLEEFCFLIVQEFTLNSADDTPEKKSLNNALLELQEKVAEAFTYYEGDGIFDEPTWTVAKLGELIPVLDQVEADSKYLAATTSEFLGQLRDGILRLRDELVRESKE